MKTLTRTINIFTQEVLLNDVRHAQLFNQSVRYLANARARAGELLAEDEVASIFDDLAVPNPFRNARVLNLHVIRPEWELPSSGLEFRPLVMSQMMEMGRIAAEKALQEGPIEPAIA